MFKSGRHPVDFSRSKTKSRRFPAPAGHCTPHLRRDPVRFGSLYIEIPSHLQSQFQRGRGVVQINRRAEDARFDIGRRRIEIIGRGQPPTAWPRIKKAVVAQMIVCVRNQNVEYDPSP